MGNEIYHDYKGLEMTMVIITLGAMRFGMELYDEVSQYREPESSILLESLGVSSYKRMVTSGKPEIFQYLKKPDESITGRDILIAEDILHTGHTMADTVLPHILQYKPNSLAIATLLLKKNSAEVEVPGKIYKGFEIEKEDYVVGELLDKEGYHRGMRGIWKVVFERD